MHDPFRLAIEMDDSVFTHDDIHWHDSLILYVHITPERDRIEMHLLCPEEWRSNTFTEQTVIFENAYGYKEFEGPIEGSPTILSVSIAGQNEQWSLVRLETNAGYREVYCRDVYIQSQ
jgi:hypothetical protein